MEISDEVLCLFSAQVEERGDRYVIEIPDREITIGEIGPDEMYRVAILPIGDQPEEDTQKRERKQEQKRGDPKPPVERGEQRTVEIEDIGDQGDGIARVERGYVIIVPDTEMNERVTIEITDVRENVGFAEVIEREEYYE